MRPRRWLAFSGLVLIGLGLLIAPALAGNFSIDGALVGVGFAVAAAMGGLIVARRDGHLTGWLLLGLGVAIVFANGFALLPGISDVLVAWVESWSWTLVFGLYALLALTFPSGRLPQRDQVGSRLSRAAVWALPLLVLAAPFTETLAGSDAGVDNPMGFLPTWLSWVPPLGTFGVLLGAATLLVIRRRRAGGVERAQLSWVVFALALLALVLAGTFVFILASIGLGRGDPGDEAWGPAFLLMILFPVAFAVAILRFRLFDIDRLVSRTVSYAVLVALLTALFASITVFLPQGLGLVRGSPLVVAAATLATAALFNPLRRRVQFSVDRRFNRARYDAEREADRFAGRLRSDLGMEDLTGELIEVISKTMQPNSVAVWVRDPGATG
jgi:hypothetical protein